MTAIEKIDAVLTIMLDVTQDYDRMGNKHLKLINAATLANVLQTEATMIEDCMQTMMATVVQLHEIVKILIELRKEIDGH